MYFFFHLYMQESADNLVTETSENNVCHDHANKYLSNFSIDESENHSSDRLITLAFVYEVRVTLLSYWMKTDIVFSLNQTVSMETVVFHNSIRNKGGG